MSYSCSLSVSSHEKRLKELAVFRLEKRRLSWIFIPMSKYLMGRDGGEGTRFWQVT